jgi:hypothetical protein
MNVSTKMIRKIEKLTILMRGPGDPMLLIKGNMQVTR